MKKVWKIFFNISLAILALAPIKASSQTLSNAEWDRLDGLTLSEMLNDVKPDAKEADLIRKFQTKEATDVLNKSIYGRDKDIKIESIRKGEVIVITIPADKLFAPNDTVLKENAGKYLAPIKRYFKHPDTYRVLLAMHSDNTGSEVYRNKITGLRVDDVTEWFTEAANDDETLCIDFLFPYAMADDDPVIPAEFKNNEDYDPNDSMKKRARNRRLEIFLMPGNEMVKQAKKGRIAF